MRPNCVSSAIAILLTILSVACTNPSGSHSVKFKQYFLKGEQLYVQHCSNCHQKNGAGLARLYPPLDSSDYMNINASNVLCLIKNGKSGDMIVNGINFNQPMPAFPQLTDIEIAQVATYIYNSWSNQKGIIEIKDVTSALSECKD
jgi:cytochrome c551